ncbi:hypothetical protein REPUB_Repub12eG0140300 [Reevesia pubescens]
MKMGIERVMKEKFGDAVKDVRQVYDDEAKETTVELLRITVGEGKCYPLRATGPESIGSGIKAAIKEKFPYITNVVLTD